MSNQDSDKGGTEENASFNSKVYHLFTDKLLEINHIPTVAVSKLSKIRSMLTPWQIAPGYPNHYRIIDRFTSLVRKNHVEYPGIQVDFLSLGC